MSEKNIKKEMLAEKRARHKEKLQADYKDWCVSHNAKPVTRRDFLGAGLISFSASMTFPTLAGMLLPSEVRAQSAECPSSVAGASMTPFVTLNLSGGAGLSGNFVPMDAGRQLISTYSRMGLGDNQLPIIRDFGNAPWAGHPTDPAFDITGDATAYTDGTIASFDDTNDNTVQNTVPLISKFYAGLLASTSYATRQNAKCVAIPVRSRDDSGDNPFDASGMVAQAGLIGSQLPNLGSRATDTGIRHVYANVKPPTPLVVGNYNDIASALALGAAGPLSDGRGFNDSQRVSLVRLVQNLSSSQANKVNANAGGRMLANLVRCANNKNVELAESPPPALDVRLNAALSTAWGATGQNDNNRSVVFGSMVNAGLQGNAGTVNLEMGGYDYHNGTRTRGDRADYQAGQTVGRVLESARILNQKVFIYVTSDGSVVSVESNARDTVWRSDRGSAGMIMFFVYDPAAAPQVSDFQVGQFTNGQAADDQYITGNSPALAASAIVANYLQFAGRTDLLTAVLGSVFNTSDMNEVIKTS